MTYKLFITNQNYSSWSLRPWLLMKELGIPFQEEMRPLRIPPDATSFSQPQWSEFSPVCHVPCLHSLETEEDKNPIIIWESIAILDFLAEEFPDKHIWPADKRARAWARSAVAEMHAGFSTMRQEMGMNIGLRVQLSEEAFNDKLKADIKRISELWKEGMETFGGPFLAGREFTAVDAFFAPVVLRFETYLGAKERLRYSAKCYANVMLEVKGVKEWVAAALEETGRDEPHDRESVEGPGRVLVEDLRAGKE
ncbi:putative GST-like protein [Podospora australis]|uniref:GST-like protein n=1 Tax=Podospora australis TaxID=1536484 RepID=A0AAN6X2Y6_9PEZI|nr:putative GST-like protein [Podospora australis]